VCARLSVPWSSLARRPVSDLFLHSRVIKNQALLHELGACYIQMGLTRAIFASTILSKH